MIVNENDELTEEDRKDLKVFEERKDEESISFEIFIKKLKIDG